MIGALSDAVFDAVGNSPVNVIVKARAPVIRLRPDAYLAAGLPRLLSAAPVTARESEALMGKGELQKRFRRPDIHPRPATFRLNRSNG